VSGACAKAARLTSRDRASGKKSYYLGAFPGGGSAQRGSCNVVGNKEIDQQRRLSLAGHHYESAELRHNLCLRHGAIGAACKIGVDFLRVHHKSLEQRQQWAKRSDSAASG
jgi:hypothetical protein